MPRPTLMEPRPSANIYNPESLNYAGGQSQEPVSNLLRIMQIAVQAGTSDLGGNLSLWDSLLEQDRQKRLARASGMGYDSATSLDAPLPTEMTGKTGLFTGDTTTPRPLSPEEEQAARYGQSVRQSELLKVLDEKRKGDLANDLIRHRQTMEDQGDVRNKETASHHLVREGQITRGFDLESQGLGLRQGELGVHQGQLAETTSRDRNTGLQNQDKIDAAARKQAQLEKKRQYDQQYKHLDETRKNIDEQIKSWETTTHAGVEEAEKKRKLVGLYGAKRSILQQMNDLSGVKMDPSVLDVMSGGSAPDPNSPFAGMPTSEEEIQKILEPGGPRAPVNPTLEPAPRR